MELLDTDGNRFPIAVTGTTDNSLLTLQPFLTRQAEGCQLVQREGKPVMLLSKEEVCLGLRVGSGLGLGVGLGSASGLGLGRLLSKEAVANGGPNPNPSPIPILTRTLP